MEPCLVCGASAMTTTLVPAYEDASFGIPITIHNGVFRHNCAKCGFDGVEIPDGEGLEAVIAVARLMVPVILSGSEIRFLRKACHMTGKEFAEAVGVDNATVSRWENREISGSIGEVSDRTIRETVWGLLYQKTPALSIEPGFFRKMKITKYVEGNAFPQLEFERVRLKDPVRHTKSDEWDVAA
ncbi:HTH cro/C1-type domain-containing protein [uncultured Gammaproteobacteria bacterium]